MPTWMEILNRAGEGKGIEQQGSVQYGGRVQGGTDHTSNMHAALQPFFYADDKARCLARSGRNALYICF